MHSVDRPQSKQGQAVRELQRAPIRLRIALGFAAEPSRCATSLTGLSLLCVMEYGVQRFKFASAMHGGIGEACG